ncbi:Membrane-bound lytic murein transglycosylase D precursor [Chryseobacterium taklimakanense]|uniref:Membrane-bound lytic murein transglycosylase D n=1 Tax=Chryseobacterium taklimakanense TaxID=536441 RepID=A0A239WME9_9FLAO|nr:lytic transglycosylase domain-containing protein [Chryseobacterium taklimakanense]SNV34784.1 Membrane-bound lytic murein transglycosylase D precursor [Chryseobacterium taklimakanense]
MKTKKLKYIITLFYLLISLIAAAQDLTATDTSESTIRRYQNIIKNNRQLVKFVEYTFASRGIPKHMRNLAIIESGLDHQIVSHAGAKGMWQFMVEHASQYGLSDEERSDIYKSTKTAAVSLINLYNKYGSWITVVAAYNCGEGNIKKAMDRAGSKQYTAFAPYLPLETQNHVKKFLNACYATNELNQVLGNHYKMQTQAMISGAAPKKSITYAHAPTKKFKKSSGKGLSETTINAAYKLNIIAKFISVSPEKILAWNPGIEKKLAEKGESIFYLPDDKMVEFQLNQNKILTSSLNN